MRDPLSFDLESELSLVVNRLLESGEQLRQLDGIEAKQVISQARERFVEGNPRAWWMALKHDPKRMQFSDDATKHLPEFFGDHCGNLLLILETGQTPMPIVEAKVDVIILILADLPLVEYYILDQKLQRLVIEDDHGMIHLVDAPRANFPGS